MPNNNPPKLAKKFLLWFIRDDLAEEVQGDLEEKFHETFKRKSLFRAKLNYWYQVFNYARPFAIRKLKTTYSHPNYTAMFKHNFIISIRNFRRHRISFLINLIGLSTGLACALLIYLWINDELSIDKFHEKNSHLYQVMENHQTDAGILTQPNTPDLLARTLAEEMPEVELATAVIPGTLFKEIALSAGEDRKVKAVGEFAEKEFFRIFSYELTQGEENLVLADKNSIVLSEKLAIKLFNTTENIIGKTIEWKLLNLNKQQATVSGIFKGTPRNSTAQFDFVLSCEAWLDLYKALGGTPDWDNHNPYTFLVLREGTDLKQFNEKISGFIKARVKGSNITLFATSFSNQYLNN